MAEGWVRHLKVDMIEPYSAGIEKHGLNPLAVRVMADAGVDISRLKQARPWSNAQYVKYTRKWGLPSRIFATSEASLGLSQIH